MNENASLARTKWFALPLVSLLSNNYEIARPQSNRYAMRRCGT